MVLLLTMKMVKVMIIRGFMVMVVMEFMRMGIGGIHYYCDILFFYCYDDCHRYCFDSIDHGLRKCMI